MLSGLAALDITGVFLVPRRLPWQSSYLDADFAFAAQSRPVPPPPPGANARVTASLRRSDPNNTQIEPDLVELTLRMEGSGLVPNARARMVAQAAEVEFNNGTYYITTHDLELADFNVSADGAFAKEGNLILRRFFYFNGQRQALSQEGFKALLYVYSNTGNTIFSCDINTNETLPMQRA